MVGRGRRAIDAQERVHLLSHGRTGCEDTLMCKSRFIGSTSKEIVVRSMKEKMYMSMSTATLYHAANDDG
jgi:hypothetical protein